MKVYVLMDDTARPGFLPEHGLSLYIETENTHILFDAGATGAFGENARRLGLDLGRVDFAVLSHGHYDHGGGIPAFLASNRRAKVYLRREALRPHFNAAGKDIGIQLPEDPRLVPLDGALELAPGIAILPGKAPLYPMDPLGMGEGDGPDPFFHEQYLLIEEGGMRYLFTGCAHKGVLNIAAWYGPDVLIGGFHLLKQDGQQLEETVAALGRFPARYCTGHCTGQPQLAALQARLGDRVTALGAGTVLEFP